MTPAVRRRLDEAASPRERDQVRVRVTRMGVESMLEQLAVIEDDRSYLSTLETDDVVLADVRADLGIAARHLTIAQGALGRIEEALGR